MRAGCSRRLVGSNLLDLRREHIFGRFEIVARLNVHPERRTGLEELAEPQRGVRRNGLFFARDAFDPGTRHVQRSTTLGFSATGAADRISASVAVSAMAASM